MSYYISILVLILCLPIRFALACGAEAGAIRPGNKTLAIEQSFRNNRGEVITNYIIDDDGAMAAAMVTSYCNNGIPREYVELTTDQSTCLYESQKELKWESQVSSSDDDQELAKKALGVSIVKSKCGIDLKTMRAQLKANIAKGPLSCVKEPEVGIAIRKASARLAEYFKEQNDPAYLAQLNATPAQKAEYITALKDSMTQIQGLSTILNNPNATNGQLQAWLKQNVNTAFKRHNFQLTPDPNAEFNPEETKSVFSLLSNLNAELPGLEEPEEEAEANKSAGIRRVRTRCAMFGIRKEAIKNLSMAQWTARRGAPAPADGSNGQGDAK